MSSWVHLVVGSLAAVGAALALGTGAALLRYHRTGAFPAQARQAAQGQDGGVTRAQLAGMWAKIVVGLTVAGAGVAALASRGLL